MTKESLIEAGWNHMREVMIRDSQELSVDVARQVFFCGALHLWSVLVDQASGRKRPRPEVLRSIHGELEAFVETMVREEQREPH